MVEPAAGAAQTTQLSRRSAFVRQRNQLTIEVERLRAAGGVVTDLSCGNPTLCGLGVAPQQLQPLADARGVIYQPDSCGLPEARQAVARYYRRRGHGVSAAEVLLTASTSDAYGYLFKLLCDAGDAVLVPRPSYPLFAYLAQLEGVTVAALPSWRHDRFAIDLGALAQRLDDEPRCKAVIVVHPNNPTGRLIRRDEAAALLELLARRGVALIVDEVFRDYDWEQQHHDDCFGSFAAPLAGAAAAADCLRFTLSGLSKVALLPQAKLAWLVARGPEPLLTEVRGRLEIIADSYLSASTAVQLAAPAWLDEVDVLQSKVRARLAANLAALDRSMLALGPDCPLKRLDSDAGWYALIEVPRTRTDEQWVSWLLQQERLLVHPGYFFDMAEPGTMVVSLLLSEEIFAEAIQRAVACWARC